jgi:glutamine cyclotransferase
MHFGLRKFLLLIFLIVAFGCKNKKDTSLSFSAPYDGQNFNLGDEFFIKLDVDKDFKVDSISYWVDGKLIATRKNADSLRFNTKNLTLGYRMITAIVAQDNKTDTINTNVVLKSNVVPKQLSYKVENVFPHDTTAYTEGLSYVAGKFLESTGEKGASQLKWVDLKSGKTIQKTTLAPEYFGEGSLKIGDKIIMLTWQENIGFIFDAKTFKQIGNFPYQNSREGWGLTFDGKHILRSDGTNRIWLMNPKTYTEESFIEVYDNNGPVNSLNELEYINGKIYANVYLTHKIVIINPQSGVVEAELDLSALVPKNYFKTADEEQNNVLNGIAWDETAKRLFVTGKKWPKLYQISLNN